MYASAADIAKGVMTGASKWISQKKAAASASKNHCRESTVMIIFQRNHLRNDQLFSVS
jgi:hypothetical protein